MVVWANRLAWLMLLRLLPGMAAARVSHQELTPQRQVLFARVRQPGCLPTLVSYEVGVEQKGRMDMVASSRPMWIGQGARSGMTLAESSSFHARSGSNSQSSEDAKQLWAKNESILALLVVAPLSLLLCCCTCGVWAAADAHQRRRQSLPEPRRSSVSTTSSSGRTNASRSAIHRLSEADVQKILAFDPYNKKEGAADLTAAQLSIYLENLHKQ